MNEHYEFNDWRFRWNTLGMWEVGSLGLFHGRLCEVIGRPQNGSVIVVEVTDEGGLKRQFFVRSSTDLAPLPHQKLGILDTLQAVAAPELTPSQQRYRDAEVWLSDPQVGDVFHIGHVVLLRVAEVYTDGRISCEIIPINGVNEEHWGGFLEYENAAALRAQYQNKDRPGYKLSAYNTLRSDFLLKKTPSYPGGKARYYTSKSKSKNLGNGCDIRYQIPTESL